MHSPHTYCGVLVTVLAELTLTYGIQLHQLVNGR